MKLFELAQENLVYVQDLINTIKAKHEADNKWPVYERFANHVIEDGKISINMSQFSLNEFLVDGKYKNVYQYQENIIEMLEKDGVTSIDINETIKKRLKSYSERRNLFSNTFESGHMLKFAALYIGGKGISKYGSFCVLLKKEKMLDYKLLVFILGDSLLYYVNDGKVDIVKLSKEIVSGKYFHLLAIIKHECDIIALDEKAWPEMLCSNSCYIEALIEEDIVCEHIGKVLMSKADYDYYFKDLLLKNLLNELNDDEKYRLNTYKTMRTLLKNSNIDLEVYD